MNRTHTHQSTTLTNKTVSFNFVLPDGQSFAVSGRVGESILDVAHRCGVPLTGACGGSLACSTCHVVLGKDVYTGSAHACPISVDEEDLLDCVGRKVTCTSRLGCQVLVQEYMENASVLIPSPGHPAH